jgi:pimeloyl-ACP methyl ester carboxylesterase
MTAEDFLVSSEFVTRDGVPLQVAHYRAAEPRAALVLFPTAMGNACSGAYELPRLALLERGCSCVLYNPRGHGKSRGLWSVGSCAADFLDWLGTNAPAYGDAVPLVGVGHSMGATSLLTLAGVRQVFARFLLVAPTLDTRAALQYMYDAKTFPEFIDYLSDPGGDNAVVEAIFSDGRWLDPQYWRDQRLGDRLDFRTNGTGKIVFESLGRFLENVLFPGHNVVPQLAAVADRARIFLPGEDHWVSAERTAEIARDLGIPCTTVPHARDHMFSGGWPVVWAHLLDDLGRPGS